MSKRVKMPEHAPTVKIGPSNTFRQVNDLHLFFNSLAFEIIKAERIIFNPERLEIRLLPFDSNAGRKVAKTRSVHFTTKNFADYSHIFGQYEMVKEGDTFFLEPIKNEV